MASCDGKTSISNVCTRSSSRSGRITNGPTKRKSQSEHSNYEQPTIPPKAIKFTPPTQWAVTSSKFAQNTVNPIRKMVDVMKLECNPAKPLIKLSIGDPTICGVLNPAPECIQAIKKAAACGEYNGYSNSVGHEKSRSAVAAYLTHPDAPVTANDIILASGCSHAIELIVTLLANPGDNILVPCPGFPLYTTVSATLGIQTKRYNLVPERGWSVDLESMREAIDERTRAIVVNSPSNPCGGVFSRDHMKEIVAIAQEYKLPIISDEVYEHVVFNGVEHVPFSHVGQDVPILTVGSISKRFLLPGWRMGWLVINDPKGVLSSIRKDLVSLTQRILGPSSLLQGALPDILQRTPKSLFQYACDMFEANAKRAFDDLSACPGLTPIMPSGAMYLMVKVDLMGFENASTDVEFTEKLIFEESVFCLPATAFSYPGYFRIALATSNELLAEACSRIRAFCEKHYRASNDCADPLNCNIRAFP